MGEELEDFSRAHFPGMVQVIKSNQATNPAFVGFPGPGCIAPHSEFVPEAFQQLWQMSTQACGGDRLILSTSLSTTAFQWLCLRHFCLFSGRIRTRSRRSSATNNAPRLISAP